MARRRPKSSPPPPTDPPSRVRGKGLLPGGGAPKGPRNPSMADTPAYRPAKPTGNLRGSLVRGKGVPSTANLPNPNNKKGTLRGKGLAPKNPAPSKLRGSLYARLTGGGGAPGRGMGQGGGGGGGFLKRTK
jgi:hypothetical protein